MGDRVKTDMGFHMKLPPVVTVVAACVIVVVVALVGMRYFNQRGEPTVPAQRDDSQRASAPTVAPPPVARAEPPRTSPAPTPAPKPEVARQEVPTTRPDVGSATRPPVPTPPPSAAPRPPDDERYLSDVQRDKLTEFLDPKAVEAQSVAMVTMSGDAEARRYADEIAGVLTELGWRVFPGEVAGQFDGVRIRASSKATPAATRLQQALMAGGIDVSAEFGANIADIQLFVGRRR
jgi:hypothetical protein